jgi:hypothetical protein
MACKVRPDGALTRCKVLGAIPADMGFEVATLSLSDGFRSKPGAFDDNPVPATVLVGLRWVLPNVRAEAPKAPFIFGDEAALISGGHLSGGLGAKSALDCFTQDPNPHCQTHPLSWGAAPGEEKPSSACSRTALAAASTLSSATLRPTTA